MSWLSALVSIFASATDPKPTASQELGGVLEDIRLNPRQASIIERIRPFAHAAEDAWRARAGAGPKTAAEKAYDAEKKQLRAATFSGRFSYRKEESLEEHSGILLVDLDHLADLDMIRLVVEMDPHTAFCFLSPSGHGLKVGVPIDPSLHRESFLAAERYFLTQFGVHVDKACKDPSRLCFLSHDPALFVNPHAVRLEIPRPEPQTEQRPPASAPTPARNGHQVSSGARFSDDPPSIDDVRDLLRFVPPRPSYPEWIRTIAAVGSVLPTDQAVAVLNEWSPEEEEGEYAAKLRSKLETVTYATLVFQAQQNGYVRAPRREFVPPADERDVPPPDDDDVPSGLTADSRKQRRQKPPPPPIDIEEAETLGALAPAVNARLNYKAGRQDKQYVAEQILEWLTANDRLLCDISNPEEPIPYVITDDGSAVAIVGESRLLRYAIAETGINASESVFTWLVNDLQSQAIKYGRRVVLAHFSTIRGDTVYVSCGRRHMIVGRHGEPLRCEPNGTDGVLFAAEFVLPAWKIAPPMRLGALRAFQPNLIAPPEVPDYTPEAQHTLLEAWVLGAFMGVKPLPILVPIGQKGSGKSTTAKIISQVFRGAATDVSSVPSNQKDFNAAMAALPIYVIDNFDTEPQPWMVDAIATACTGGIVQERTLYTNFGLSERRLSASLAITTRTAVFAERPDIKERVLPVFYGELQDSNRLSDRSLSDQAIDNRDALLSGLTLEAASLLGDATPAAGYVSRFQEFAKVATRDPNVDGVGALSAWIKAQSLGVTDNDPLLQAILDYVGDDPLRGTPTEILKSLSSSGADIPHQGGGKAVARKFREMKPALMMAGISVREQSARDRVYFEIDRMRGESSRVAVSEMSESGPKGMFETLD